MITMTHSRTKGFLTFLILWIISRKSMTGAEIALELQKNTVTIEKIQNIADGLRTTSRRKLDELISLSNEFTTKQNQKIGDILEEIGKVEI